MKLLSERLTKLESMGIGLNRREGEEAKIHKHTRLRWGHVYESNFRVGGACVAESHDI